MIRKRRDMVVKTSAKTHSVLSSKGKSHLRDKMSFRSSICRAWWKKGRISFLTLPHSFNSLDMMLFLMIDWSKDIGEMWTSLHTEYPKQWVSRTQRREGVKTWKDFPFLAISPLRPRCTIKSRASRSRKTVAHFAHESKMGHPSSLLAANFRPSRSYKIFQVDSPNQHLFIHLPSHLLSVLWSIDHQKQHHV